MNPANGFLWHRRLHRTPERSVKNEQKAKKQPQYSLAFLYPYLNPVGLQQMFCK